MRHKQLSQDVGFALSVWAVVSFVTIPLHAQSGSGSDDLEPIPTPTIFQPNEDIYDATAHARLIYSLWGISEPAALVLNGDAVLVYTTHEDAANTHAPSEDWTENNETFLDGTGSFVIADDLLFGEEVEEFRTETDPSYTVVMTSTAMLVAGTLTSQDDVSAFIVGVIESHDASYVDAEYQANLTRLLVLDEMSNLEAATDFVDDARYAEKHPAADDDIHYTCHSAWVGNDGYQCCYLSAAYNSKWKECFNNLIRDILLCLGLSGGVAGTCYYYCLKVSPPPVSVGTCIGICAVVGVATMIVCASAYYFGYLACQAAADAWYYQQLAETGCGNPPSGAVQ